jgi:hypothetical protein
MKMKRKILLIGLLFITSWTFCQEAGSSTYTFHFSCFIDSLVQIAIKDVNIYNNTARKFNPQFDSLLFRKNFNNAKLPPIFDSAFRQCFELLKNKLGDDLTCNNIVSFRHGFSISQKQNKKEIVLDFGFKYPIKKSSNNDSNFVRNSYHIKVTEEYFAYFDFKFSIEDKGIILISSPQNIIDCQDKVNCGFIISSDKALEILQKEGILMDNDNVRFQVHGLILKVSLYQENMTDRNVSINLQTGELSNFHKARRID